MQKLTRIGAMFLLGAVGACAWVKPTPQGEQVKVSTPEAVKDCANAGTTHVSVLDKLGMLRRSEAKLAGELATLARNSAAQLGGNAVVPITEIVDGAQTFAIYKCDPDDLRD